MTGNDFKKQIAGMKLAIFRLSHRRVRTVGRSGWDHELQNARVDVLVSRRWSRGRRARRGRNGNERNGSTVDRLHQGRRGRSRIPCRSQDQRHLSGTIRALEPARGQWGGNKTTKTIGLLLTEKVMRFLTNHSSSSWLRGV